MSVKEEDHEGSQGPKSPLSSSSDEEEKAAYGALSDDDIDVDDEKTKRILAACETRNIDDLQELAMSKGGFLSDANRAHACESSPTRHFCFCVLFCLVGHAAIFMTFIPFFYRAHITRFCRFLG